MDATPSKDDAPLAEGATAPAAPAPKEDGLDTARTAGRGGVAVLGAKVFFVLVGFIQVPALQKIVGQGEYGGYSRVMSAANVINNVIVQSSTQGVSRAVAGARGLEGEALRATLRVHVPIAILLTLLCIGLAPLFASFQGDPTLTLPMVILSGVVLAYGMYAPLIGSLNGRGLFTRQAGLDVTFAILRTAGLLGVGYFFTSQGWSGMIGASIGFVTASLLIVPIAARLAGTGRAATQPDPSLPAWRPYLAGLLTIALSQLFTNLLMQIDLQVVGRFLSLSTDDEQDANRWVTVYRNCQVFAFLPYQLLFSVTQILFPMVARAHAAGDAKALREYVRRGSRLGAIVCGLFVSVLVALPWPLLNFVFGNAVDVDKPRDLPIADSGADTLRILALAQAAFALLGIAITVLNSIGKERIAGAVTLAAVLFVGAAAWIFLPGATFGKEKLLVTATAAGGGLLAALVAAGFVVRKKTGAFIPLATMLRVGAAVGACTALGIYLPHFTNRLLAPVLAAGVVVLYLGFLVVTRELTGADLTLVKAMLGKRAPK